MELSISELLDHVKNHLPDVEPIGEPQPLEGGNLNYVWRLRGKSNNIIIKHAPPYIAAHPDVPLDANRLAFEAKALELFNPSGPLHTISTPGIRPPRIYHFDAPSSLLLMEDVGELPHLAEWMKTEQGDPTIGTKLGRFIGQLHLQTIDDPDLLQRFNNQTIQQSRFEVQYKPAADYIRKAGVKGAERAAQSARELGEKLLKPGRCLVMGDLWPPSVLVGTDGLRSIDWEFVHFGRPLQDVAHLAAHCWMQAHTASSKLLKNKFNQLWQHFSTSYQQVLGEKYNELINEEERRLMNIHFSAEILVRTTGPFQDGYVYEGLPHESSQIKKAVKFAVDMMNNAEINIIDNSNFY